MPPTKKPRRDAADASAPPTDALAALPPALASAVLDFLVGDDFYHGNGRRYWSRQLAPLATIVQVSTQWRVVASEPASLRVLTTLRFRLKERNGVPGTRSEMLDMRRALILRRVHLKRLIVEDLPDFGAEDDGVWRAALSHAPKLQSLDMDTGDIVRPESRLVLNVTRAAARHCPLLRRLMFPSTMSPPTRTDEQPQRATNHLREFTQSVIECLPAWSKHGGLRHLRMTMRERVHGRQRMHTYLDAITTHCPKIEILDGFASTVESLAMITCEERWNADLDMWRRFCTTCDQLTMFDWVTVPFATAFFELFGATPKPQLTNLTFSVSALWNWRRYFTTTGPGTFAAFEATGFGGTATHAHAVFPACPRLQELRVEWFDMPSGGSIRKRLVNPEIFGDDFYDALVRDCRQLTRLQHGPLPTSRPDWSPDSLVTLTDRSLRALATLPELNWVEMVGANITGDGLFDLVIQHTAATRHERVYYFVLGDTQPDGVTSMVFYDVLKGFLERLLAYDGELPCASRPVMVQLENAHKAVLDEGWSAAYFTSLLLTIEKLQQKYPTIQLSGIVRDYNEEYGVVKRVVEFAFATASAQLPDWSEDANEVDAADDEMDGGVFLNRRYCGRDVDLPVLPGSRRDDDEPESDDEVGSGDEEADESDESEENDDDHDNVEDPFGVVDGEEIVFENDEDVDDDDDFSDEEDAEFYDAFIEVDGDDLW